MAGTYLGAVVCAGALLVGTNGAWAHTMEACPGNEAEAARAAVTVQRPVAGPEISGDTDGRHAWLTAVHRGLVVRNLVNREARTLAIELRYQLDAVSVAIEGRGKVTITRRGRTLTIDSPEALGEVQHVLGGSEAVFAFRALLAEREAVSDLKAPEMSLLASAAFVASLAGDLDAPRRLAARFVEKYRGIFRPARFQSCWDKYTKETSDAWNNMQSCMDEANQDESWFNGAYRRVACNAVWLLESESAWFEYLNCLSPLGIAK